MIENVFTDASGTMALSPGSDNARAHYVIACVYTKPSEVRRMNDLSKEIVVKRAGIGELKSSQIGSNIARRKEVLEAIHRTGLGIYVLVVDKAQVFQDSGLRFPAVSYKFLHNMIYTHLEESLGEIHVLADQYGDAEFMKSFQSYISQRSNLFSSFRFAPSPQVPLLQVADVVAGSIRRVYEGLDGIETMEALGYPAIAVEVWPPKRNFLTESGASGGDHGRDRAVEAIALRRARGFIEAYFENPGEEVQLQIRTLRYFLRKYYEDPIRFISRAEIVEAVSLGEWRISAETLSRMAIGPLRSAGVILASTDSGIKLPSAYSDVAAWLDRTQSQVVPYLGRVESARKAILLASENTIDILGEEQSDLREYILGKERLQIGK